MITVFILPQMLLKMIIFYYTKIPYLCTLFVNLLKNYYAKESILLAQLAPLVLACAIMRGLRCRIIQL
jgi:hypothetical protein